ncbi:IS1182 family transposase [Simplicispira suum]|uniref:IS1182 family transposase n=1 Tax=Simplicispira suum TaxID=2109915 RepID=UPI00235373E7|nr:IS1182 family transposase [Simplicispira suum]
MEAESNENERSGELFEGLPLPENVEAVTARTAVAKAVADAPVRVILPKRDQVELRPMDLESLLPQGHRARLVWAWVERQDLSGMYAVIKARQGGVGRSAIAPEILLGLWLYATLEGVGSARQLSRLVLEHDAYRWISGGVQVNHHSLSDFRVAHGSVLDELLSTSLAALMTAGAVKLQRVAQDGVRVRASAGAASFRRKASLQENLEQARARVRQLKAELDADPAHDSRRKIAAQQRARREMQERIEAALERLPQLEAIKRRNGGKSEARASTTDAEATVMKMADGGFRPAYNTQFAADCDTQVIVGVEVSTSGSDMARLAPMVEQVEQRLGAVPAQWLVDGGFPAHEQIDAVADKTEVYAPVPEARTRKDEQGNDVAAADKHQPKPDDSTAVAKWRQRMATEDAKELYKLRAATAECVNAQARNRGLQRMPVRGRAKVRCVALLYALAHNLMRAVALVPELLGLGPTPSACAAGAA